MGKPRISHKDLCKNGDMGDWYIPKDSSGIFIKFPNPSQTVTYWPFDEPLENGSIWKWDGNREAPTLTPSLHWVNVWHGWMKNGELIS